VASPLSNVEPAHEALLNVVEKMTLGMQFILDATNDELSSAVVNGHKTAMSS
jgi:hypothetical protein